MSYKNFYVYILITILIVYLDNKFNLLGGLTASFLFFSYFLLNRKLQGEKMIKYDYTKFSIKSLLLFCIIVTLTYSFEISILFLRIKYTNEINLIAFNIFNILKFVFLFPILEELVFRKLLFNSLLVNYSFKGVLFVSSFGFSLCHIFSGQGVLFAFIGGLVFGYAYFKTKNIMLVIFLHGFYNLLYIVITPKLLNYVHFVN